MSKFKLLLSALLIGFSQLASAGPLFDAAIASLTTSSGATAVQDAIDAAAAEGMDLGSVVAALQTRGVQSATILTAINNNINGTSASRYAASNPAVNAVLTSLTPRLSGGTGTTLSFTSFNNAMGGNTSGTGGPTSGVSPR